MPANQVPQITDFIAQFEQAHQAKFGQPLDRPWTYDADATAAGQAVLDQYLTSLAAFNKMQGTDIQPTAKTVAEMPVSSYAASLPSNNKASGGFFGGGALPLIGALAAAYFLGPSVFGAMGEGAGALEAFGGAGPTIGATTAGGSANIAADGLSNLFTLNNLSNLASLGQNVGSLLGGGTKAQPAREPQLTEPAQTQTAKTPEMDIFKKKLLGGMPGGDPTLLTGPSGIDLSNFTLGKPTLLGA